MESLYRVSSSPHVRSTNTTDGMMKNVIIGLIPATLVGFWVFGLAAIFTVAISTLSAVFFEYIYQKSMKLPIRVGDYSAALTGLLLGLNLPAMFPGSTGTTFLDYSLPITIPIIGSAFAIIVVKQLFGGIGFNIMNPALAARVFLLISFAGPLTTWPKVMPMFNKVDAVSGATILGAIKEGKVIDYSVMDAFIGTVPGCIGEISALALIVGGCYLIYKKVITYHIPVFYIGTVLVFVGIYTVATGQGMNYLLLQMFSGGLMLGAFFMATDYVTTPMNKKGQIIFAIGCGVITSLIRLVGSYPEGVSFSIIIMNLTVPIIDKYTIPRCFGEVKNYE